MSDGVGGKGGSALGSKKEERWQRNKGQSTHSAGEWIERERDTDNTHHASARVPASLKVDGVPLKTFFTIPSISSQFQEL